METYTVRPGETLSLIAARYGCTVEEIVNANDMISADRISVGQTIRIPVQPAVTGPALKLIPNSDLVYGPAFIDFELETFVAGQGGYLASYSE
ncbi:MAG: LysM domain-containing protein, partial [Anaerolineae bacterium]